MNCPQCGTLNSSDSRFCGRCGAALPPAEPPLTLPVVGAIDGEGVAKSAGGLVGVLEAVLGALGLGMAADYLVNRVAGRVVSCACGCLILAGLLVCVLAAGLLQTVQIK